MFGWFRTAAARASRRKRSMKPWSFAYWGWRTLTATSRPSTSSWARYTSPMPPDAIRPMMRYRPATVGSMAATDISSSGDARPPRGARTILAPVSGRGREPFAEQRQQQEGRHRAPQACQRVRGLRPERVDERPREQERDRQADQEDALQAGDHPAADGVGGSPLERQLHGDVHDRSRAAGH